MRRHLKLFILPALVGWSFGWFAAIPLRVVFAQTEQHFDMTRVLVGIDGKPLTALPSTDPKAVAEPILLSDIVIRALFAPTKSDDQIGPTEKGKWLEDMRALAKRVYHAKNVVLTPEEITMIKYRIATVGFPNETAGAALELFEPPKK